MNDRNRKLLDLAKDKPCLLRLTGVCNHNPATTVAAHSNQLRHGKGTGIKAHDWASVWACSACHAELDQGNRLDKQQKVALFDAALVKQDREWLKMCLVGTAKEQAAAKWALVKLWGHDV